MLEIGLEIGLENGSPRLKALNNALQRDAIVNVGKGGGYWQVIEDWKRKKGEKAACRPQ
ncbi:hypothetical protein IMZ48_49895 [Candidatus Bathyarchaeota archaeon]|nr:hypothetical protein [Candidatus Bathyarchaeota archaeon]